MTATCAPTIIQSRDKPMSIQPIEDAATSGRASLLYEPITFRGTTLRNRVVVSPMAMYSSVDGFADDFHLVHLGRFALGGAGLVFMEATAISSQGRITPGCNGLWLDAQVPALTRITNFLHRFGSAAGMQLAHSGWKGSTRRPWHGGSRLDDEDLALRQERGWPIVSATEEAFDGETPGPMALTESELAALLDQYRAATRRAIVAGFDVLEIHAAHGYLLHSFLSPLSNKRDDRYGGVIENRKRFPLRVVEAVRDEWPADKPLFVRISAVDGLDVGWTIEDSVVFAKALAARGVDVVDCSTGGMKLPRDKNLVSRSPGFQVPFAARIRKEAEIATMAVGLILEPKQAEAILAAGAADLIALGREMLVNPNFAALAALELEGASGWDLWSDRYRYWLERRARALRRERGA
jgi:2,4-dienoyl-CoA reductase-like NADH-dependent reductase (Old Yellow Enzyme family)